MIGINFINRPIRDHERPLPIWVREHSSLGSESSAEVPDPHRAVALPKGDHRALAAETAPLRWARDWPWAGAGKPFQQGEGDRHISVSPPNAKQISCKRPLKTHGPLSPRG